MRMCFQSCPSLYQELTGHWFQTTLLNEINPENGEKHSPFSGSLGKFSFQPRTNKATPLPQAFFQGKDGSHNLTKHSAPLLVFYYITQWYKIFMKELLVQSLEAFHLLACLHRLTPLKFSQGLRVSTNSSQIANEFSAIVCFVVIWHKVIDFKSSKIEVQTQQST